jgi:hypothetical protein
MTVRQDHSDFDPDLPVKTPATRTIQWDTLDVTLPSSFIPTTAPSNVRKLVLRLSPIISMRTSPTALARMIRPIANVVETVTLHADSLFAHSRRTVRQGRKRLPLLLDCLCRVDWQRLRSIELVVLGNRAEKRSEWSFVSCRKTDVGFQADHLRV